MHPIEQLTSLFGIGQSYYDWRGELREVSLDAQAAILAALGVDARSDAAISSEMSRQQTVRWTHVVPPVTIAAVDMPVHVGIAVARELRTQRVRWSLALESGAVHSGHTALAALALVEEGEADGRAHARYSLELPALPAGYHTLSIEFDSALSGTTTLIVAPRGCYEPAMIAQRERAWGIAVQLYSLRSTNNWGIGDFGDLRELIRWVAPSGCHMIGLNPLHALTPADPKQISPYSPSSRLFLNVLYICVPQVAEFATCAPARKRVGELAFQTQLAQLRATVNVDYVGVAAVKFEILRMLYTQFRAEHLAHDTPRARSFRNYVEQCGSALHLHALYDALDAHLRLQGPQYWGWPSWPEDFREPTSPTVVRFARERAEEVEYFLYLQWLAAEQLDAAQRASREAGMAIGLYGDVAVGASPSGSETWSNRHLYVDGASVGAPPDALALKGQDWGIPPQNPLELKAQRYRPFIDLLRNNMRHVAALRLDHVMALYRLWWVPRGFISRDGAYVQYPVDDLMAVLALESTRNECAVIGEDLGTVAEPMLRAMERYGAYHYKVLMFEQDAEGRFKQPHEYTRGALATVTTHDLPTLRGWWEAHDVELRERLDLYPSVEFKEQARATREVERVRLMQALVEARVWHWQDGEPLPEYSAALSRAVHVFLGLSNANMTLVQIEDLIGMTEPVNVPGTFTEHPNWQRKVTLDTAEIFARPEVWEILEGVQRSRQGVNPNR